MLLQMMEWYDLTEDERKIRDLALEVAEQEIAPRAERHDLEGTYVRDSIQALGEAGLLGVNVPKEYGGLGGSQLATMMAVEAISAACGSTGSVYHFHLGVNSILKGAGPESLRQKYLPGLAKDKLAAFAFNERKLQFWQEQFETVLDDRGDHFVISGEKPFVTAAGEADVYIVHSQKADSMFRGQWSVIDQAFMLVDSGPGVIASRIYDPMGIRGASNGTMKFEDAKVPKENVVGGPPWSGMRTLTAKSASSLGPGIVATGLAGAAYDACVRHVRTSGEGNTEWIRHMLGDMTWRLNAMRAYHYYAARTASKTFIPTAGITLELKIEAGEDAPWICDRAMEIMGGGSFMRSSPIQRYYRDARATAYVNLPMSTRREGAAGNRMEVDALAEHPLVQSMPWEEDAILAYRMLSARGARQFRDKARTGAFSAQAFENYARAQGESELSLDSVMEYMMKQLMELQPGEMAQAGAPAGRPA